MTAADQPTTEPSAEGLEIVNGWLVQRGAHEQDYPAGPEWGPMPYSDAEPLVHLSELPGWPAPAPQPAADTETEVQWGVRRPNGTHFKASSRDGADRVIAGRGDGDRVRRVATKTTNYTPWEEA